VTDAAPEADIAAGPDDAAPPARAIGATPRPGRRRLAVLLAAAIAVVVIAVLAATAFGGPGRQVKTGIVVAVHATSLSDVQGFTILTPDGQMVDFRIGRLETAGTFPPGHLAEHKVSLVPVRVTYVDEAGVHIAERIEDAP
jgi:hypothetical protein